MKTLVFGAAPNPSRYAYLATQMLTGHGHEVIPFGIKKGKIGNLEIQNTLPQDDDIDTITLYIGPARQPEYYDYFMDLKPKRIIFNPGTENPTLEQMARENGIQPLRACTLVMLSTGQY